MNMRQLKAAGRAIGLAPATVGAWMQMAVIAWAQTPNQQKAPETSSGAGPWVWAYALVILCVGLGMLLVIRTAKRRDRAKPQQYGE